MTVTTVGATPVAGQEEPVASNIQELLKASTDKEHTSIGNHLFIKGVFKAKQGVSDRAYCQYLVDLELLHRTLEDVLEGNQRNPSVAPLCIPEIYRSERIRQDLESFVVGDIEPSPAALAYVDHISEVAKKKPYLLIAHAYVRYLADMSGGQFMSRATKRLWPDREMHNFYNFSNWLDNVSEASKMSELRDHYRAIMNAIMLTPSQMEEIDNEAHLAYEHTCKMLNELLKIPHWDAKTTVCDEDVFVKLKQSTVSGDLQLLRAVHSHLGKTYPSLGFAIDEGGLTVYNSDQEVLIYLSALDGYSEHSGRFEKNFKVAIHGPTVREEKSEEFKSFYLEVTKLLS